MNGINSIMITPVANGWIVRLPEQNSDPFEQSIAVGMKFAKEMQKDPMLSVPEEDPEQNNDKLKRETGTHIFLNFSDVLSFLKFKFSEA